MEGVNMEGANKRGAHANGGGRRGARVRPFVPRINERSHSICYLRGLLNGRSAARGWRDIDARGNERPSFSSSSSSPLSLMYDRKGGRRRLSPDATKGAI